MAEFQYKSSLHSVGNYQVSGIPYATGSLTAPASSSAPIEVAFPSVTQKIIIHNHNPTLDIRAGFSANGVKGTNYLLVDAEEPTGAGTHYVELRVKTDRIFLLSDSDTSADSIYVTAELTGIITGVDLAASYSGSSGIG